VGQPQGYAGTSYAGNYQVFATPGSTLTNGISYSQYTIGNIPDGSSNVVLFAEQYGSAAIDENIWATPLNMTYGNTGPGGRWVQGGPVSNFAGYADCVFAMGPLVGGVITTPPSWIPPPEFNVRPKSATGVNTPAAIHGSVMLVLLGDGSVRRVTSGISDITWAYAVSPADGQPMPGDW